MNKPGVYRVIYNLPGSLGYYSQQFIYSPDVEKSVTDLAEEFAVEKESERYNVKASKINILDIEFIRNVSGEQKKLPNNTLKS